MMDQSPTQPGECPITKRPLDRTLVKMQCNECGKKFQVRATCSTGPYCPKCDGADVDVRES